MATGSMDVLERPSTSHRTGAPTGIPTATTLRSNARTLLAAGRRREAIGALMLALDPAGPDSRATVTTMAAGIMGELAAALLEDGNPEMALSFAEQAFRRVRSAAHAATLSCVLIELGRDQDALQVTDQVAALKPVSPAVWVNRSIALEGLGRMGQAVDAARQVLAVAPRSALARLHLGTTLLAQGRLTPEAWRLYEGRLDLPGVRRLPEAIRWTGSELAGKTLLLHAEQGLGDTLQFARYAPLVAARTGARVVLAVQPSLERLLQGAPGTDAVVQAGGTLPTFDAFAPLLSLPMVFGTTLSSIPPPLGYPGIASPNCTQPSNNNTLQVGVVWAGSRGFVSDHQRSLPERLLPILGGLSGVALYSLQFGASPGDAERLGMIDRIGGVDDFYDTAARIAGLDLVIAVDTSVAHLAATMGKPVWLLSRFRGCWRWMHGRTDSPWYPTMRIFRQQRAGDWPGVLALVRAELQKQCEIHRGIAA